MGPHTEVMSNNENFQNNSTLPSDVEEDKPPYHCAIRTCILDNYTPTHPLAIGNSTFSRRTPQQNLDIAPKLSPYEQYKDEVNRLKTFSDWPSHAPVQKKDLARNGFIFLHVIDRTQCVFCRGILSNWESGDVVENEHRRTCPDCPLAFGYECGNRPIIRTTPAEHLPSQQQRDLRTYNTTVNIPSQSANTYQHTFHIVRNVTSEDEVGHVSNISDIEPPNRADASGHFPSPLPSIPSQQSLPSLSPGNVSLPEPKYPQWADENLRIQSFMGWPAQMLQKPRDLAHAGLLYMGNSDRCKCYWCGGELYDWEHQDDPMEEHAKWFSHCNYVRNLKGDTYIQYVKDKQNGLIVEPSELMSKPHVLAVLHMGYKQEQIEEVVKRYGITKLTDANKIMQAIEETNRERQAILQQLNTHNSTQHASQSQDDDNTSMEIDESELNLDDLTNVKDSTTVGVPDSVQSTSNTQNDVTQVLSSATKTKGKDVDTVLLENEKLKDQKLCKICMDRDLCVTFQPCSHFVTCAECSENLQECPLCRKQIHEKLKVYWS